MDDKLKKAYSKLALKCLVQKCKKEFKEIAEVYEQSHPHAEGSSRKLLNRTMSEQS